MKYCKHCGKKIPSKTVFCPYCGTKQDFVSGTSNQSNQPKRPRATVQRTHPNPNNLNMMMNNDKDDTTKKVLIVVGIIVAVVIGILLILGVLLPAISQIFMQYS